MTQKTAVEILIEKIKLKDKTLYWELCDELEQAKEMEKQQIIDAHLLGLVYPLEMEATKQIELIDLIPHAIPQE